MFKERTFSSSLPIKKKSSSIENMDNSDWNNIEMIKEILRDFFIDGELLSKDDILKILKHLQGLR
jgi:hypothetical protein